MLGAHAGSLYRNVVARTRDLGASGDRGPVRQQPWRRRSYQETKKEKKEKGGWEGWENFETTGLTVKNQLRQGWVIRDQEGCGTPSELGSHESVSGKILGTLRWRLTNFSKSYFTLTVRVYEGAATPSILRSHGSMLEKLLGALPNWWSGSLIPWTWLSYIYPDLTKDY